VKPAPVSREDEFRAGLVEAISMIDARGGYVTPQDLDALERLRLLITTKR
jgi:hypothetical protein